MKGKKKREKNTFKYGEEDFFDEENYEEEDKMLKNLFYENKDYHLNFFKEDDKTDEKTKKRRGKQVHYIEPKTIESYCSDPVAFDEYNEKAKYEVFLDEFTGCFNEIVTTVLNSIEDIRCKKCCEMFTQGIPLYMISSHEDIKMNHQRIKLIIEEFAETVAKILSEIYEKKISKEIIETYFNDKKDKYKIKFNDKKLKNNIN